MLALLASVALSPVAYGLAAGTAPTFQVGVTFDGFIPLFGGQEGKVEVQLTVQASGLDSKDAGNFRARAAIEDIEVKFNGAPMPVTLGNVRQFLPPSEVDFTPSGRILKIEAPEVRLPVRLPGLDPKRLADISYLPIEFPEAGVQAGVPFEFKRSFNDSDVIYTVTPTSVTDDVIEMKLVAAQTYAYLEDEGLQAVKEERDAESRVETKLAGEGTATFDRKRGLVSRLEVKATADSTVTNLRTQAKSERKLSTVLAIRAQ
jgi:hypothetical protein